MTKEQLMQKWGDLSRPLKNDIDAVIEYEIAKSKEPQPAPNPIAEAYERWEKINKKTWEKGLWIKKHSNNESMQEDGCVVFSSYFNFNEYPELWELYTEPAKQPEPNPIAEAYERGEKIRLKDWRKSSYIKKQSKKQFIDERGSTLYHHNILGFDTHPEKWELYTEPAEQPAKPFDRERFEAMFRAVVASGRTESYEQDFLATNICLEKLDAYYATKEGGEND